MGRERMVRLEIGSECEEERPARIGLWGGFLSLFRSSWNLGQGNGGARQRNARDKPVAPAVESGYGKNSRHAGHTRCTSIDPLNPLEKAGCGVQ